MGRESRTLTIVINGGVHTLQETLQHLEHVDGVMIGRAAYQNPEMFARADELVFCGPEAAPHDPLAVLDAMDHYISKRRERFGDKPCYVAKHLVGLFKGKPRAKIWRRELTETMYDTSADFRLSNIYRKVFC